MQNPRWLVDARGWVEDQVATVRARGIAAFGAADPAEARAALADLERLVEVQRLLELIGQFLPEAVANAAGPQDEPPASSAEALAGEIGLAEPSDGTQSPNGVPHVAGEAADLGFAEQAHEASGALDLERSAALSADLQTQSEPQSLAAAEPPPPALVEETVRPTDEPVGLSPAEVPANGAAVAPPRQPARKTKKGLSDRPVPTLKEVCGRLRELEEKPEWTKADEATAKALVCDFRAVEAGGLSPDEKSWYKKELERLSELFGRHASRSEFFGFNSNRKPGFSTWLNLGEAYSLMAEAENAYQWLAENPCPDNDQLALYVLSAAAESLVHRLIEDLYPNASDEQQTDLHQRLKEKLEDQVIRAWLPGGSQRLSDAEVRKQAQELPVRFRDVVERFQTGQKKQAAFDHLDQVLSDDHVDDFENRLVSAVERLLEAKVPPSNKDLRSKLMPYRSCLEALDSKLGKKLLNFITEDFEKESGTLEEREVDGECESDTGALSIDPDVLAYTQGKTFMILGGNKGQEKRKETYKTRFGFTEVIWPDLERDSNPFSVRHLLDQADIVAYAVRFSRHSYKKIIDEAKEKGKAHLTLKAGLSSAQVARALQTQVLSPAVRR